MNIIVIIIVIGLIIKDNVINFHINKFAHRM